MYTKNQNFFREETPTSAYWAGFIAADGYIKTKDCVAIRLSIKDRAHLEWFAKNSGYNGKIRVYTECGGFSDKTIVATVTVCGVRQWVDDLAQIYNIVPKKSLILQPPKITKAKLVYSYIKGYIDGDGHIEGPLRQYETKNGIKQCPHLRIKILGTLDVLSWIKRKTQATTQICHRKNKLYVIAINGKIAFRFAKLANKYCNIGLSRKWDKVAQYQALIG